jgi:hypothetical protein
MRKFAHQNFESRFDVAKNLVAKIGGVTKSSMTEL